MNKLLTKIFFGMTLILGIMGISNACIFAEIKYETEPNDTMENAETITANNETAAGAANATYAGQSVISGDTSITDSDWYKVYLTAGTNYITCNSCSFEYMVVDENGNTILMDTHLNSSSGPMGYEFNISTDGYYYVRITGVTSSSKNYLFLIGSPTYLVGSCEISCSEGSISMTSNGGNQLGHFDGTMLSNIPEDAVAYSVRMSGIRSTYVKSILLENNQNGTSFSLASYTWDKEGLISMNMPVASVWTASFGYKKVGTFTPVLKVNYAYPVYNNSAVAE